MNLVGCYGDATGVWLPTKCRGTRVNGPPAGTEGMSFGTMRTLPTTHPSSPLARPACSPFPAAPPGAFIHTERGNMKAAGITRRDLERAAETLQRIHDIESLRGGYVVFGDRLVGGKWFPDKQAAREAQKAGLTHVIVALPYSSSSRDALVNAIVERHRELAETWLGTRGGYPRIAEMYERAAERLRGVVMNTDRNEDAT